MSLIALFLIAAQFKFKTTKQENYQPAVINRRLALTPSPKLVEADSAQSRDHSGLPWKQINQATAA